MRRRRLALALTAALGIAVFAPSPGLGAMWRVYGPSMEPTITDGSLVVVDTVEPSLDGYRRGDIVILTPPDATSGFPLDTVIKRVIGLPGEHVVVDDGTVAVDGTTLREPYLPAAQHAVRDVPGRHAGPEADLVVPPDSVFVLGDHRSASRDSTTFGPVPVESLHGRVVLIVASRGIRGPGSSPLPGVVVPRR